MNSKIPIVFRKTSLIDYPGLISAVIFFPGCNLRCPWCHNREMIIGNVIPDCISLAEALIHLKKRRNILGGVVLSGGEPTLFAGIGELICLIKELGLKLKLDTNGLLPDVLQMLFENEKIRPDYIAMDLKTSPLRYRELLPMDCEEKTKTGKGTKAQDNDPGNAVMRSAALIRASNITHEFRSINLPLPPGRDGEISPLPYFGEDEKAALALIAGNSPWFIRPFIPGNCLDPAWDNAGEIA